MGEHVTGFIDVGHPFAILFTLVPALINLVIFVYVALYLPKNPLNITFTLFVLLLAFWQLSEGMMHVSLNPVSSLKWYHVTSIPSLGVCALEVVFALQFAEWHKKIPPIIYYAFLAIPGLLLMLMLNSQMDDYTISSSALWNWVASPRASAFTDVFYLALTVYSLTALFIFFFYYLRVRNIDVKRQQALLLLIGFSVPVLGGIVGEVILPLLFGMDDVPVTVPLVTVFSVLALIAIRRYGLLDYSPLNQVERVLQTMNEGIVIVDKTNTIMYVNDKFLELTYYSEAELLGKKAAYYLADDISRNTLEEAYKLRQQNISNRYQIQVQRKDGSMIWLNVAGFPYLDDAGNVVGAVGMTTDITELMHTQMQLKKKINDLNIFFYKTAHDFKTPIASMQGLLDVYSKDDNIEELLHYVKLCVKNLSQIVSRVSQLSVIQQQQVVKAEINVRTLLDKILRDLKQENVPVKEVRFDVQLQSDTMVTELFLLSSILKNLIDNGIKYSDANRPSFVSIEFTIEAGMYKFVVKDNGIGIPADIQEKIFDMFYRGNDKSKGAGLGLYIVKSAVEKLNGSITVKSELGEGSVFTVLLPA